MSASRRLLAVACLLLWTVSVRGDDPPSRALHGMSADGSGVHEFLTVPYESVYSPEMSPDGTKVAVDAWQGPWAAHQSAHVLVIHLDDNRIQDLGVGCMPSWSADGQWIACSKYGEGVFIRTINGEMEQLIDRNGWGIQWSPDGRRLAYTMRGQLVVYDIETQTKRNVFPVGDNRYDTIYWNCAWSPDSKRICFRGHLNGGGHELAIADAGDEPGPLKVLCPADDINPDIAWQPGTDRIVFPRSRGTGETHGQMHFVPADGSAAPQRLPGQPTDRTNGGMSWTRDGGFLVFMSSR